MTRGHLRKYSAIFGREAEATVRVQIRDQSHPLCSRRLHAQVMRVRHLQDSVVHCGKLNKFLKGVVLECSDFHRRGSMTIWDMRQTAWMIDLGPKGKIGFVRPGDKRHAKMVREMPILEDED